MKIRRKISILAVSMVMLVSNIATAYALVYPPSYYDNIAWTWSYYAPNSNSYNCLAYARGITNQWIWPWSGNPTNSQVTTYLQNLGYKKMSYSPNGPYPNTRIISYGTTSGVRHFSKSILYGSTWIGGKSRAKWGSLEVMTSNSHNPYHPTPYGYIVSKYY